MLKRRWLGVVVKGVCLAGGRVPIGWHFNREGHIVVIKTPQMRVALLIILCLAFLSGVVIGGVLREFWEFLWAFLLFGFQVGWGGG